MGGSSQLLYKLQASGKLSLPAYEGCVIAYMIDLRLFLKNQLPQTGAIVTGISILEIHSFAPPIALTMQLAFKM